METLQREKPGAVTLAKHLLWASLAVGRGNTALSYTGFRKRTLG